MTTQTLQFIVPSTALQRSHWRSLCCFLSLIRFPRWSPCSNVFCLSSQFRSSQPVVQLIFHALFTFFTAFRNIDKMFASQPQPRRCRLLFGRLRVLGNWNVNREIVLWSETFRRLNFWSQRRVSPSVVEAHSGWKLILPTIKLARDCWIVAFSSSHAPCTHTKHRQRLRAKRVRVRVSIITASWWATSQVKVKSIAREWVRDLKYECRTDL